MPCPFFRSWPRCFLVLRPVTARRWRRGRAAAPSSAAAASPWRGRGRSRSARTARRRSRRCRAHGPRWYAQPGMCDDRWSFNVLRIVRDLDVVRMGRWEWDLLFYEYFFVGHRQVCSCLIYAKGNFPVRFAGSLMCHFHWKSLDQGTECCHTWMGKDGKVWSPASVESGGSCDICPSRERMSIGNPGVPHQSPQSLQSAT